MEVDDVFDLGVSAVLGTKLKDFQDRVKHRRSWNVAEADPDSDVSGVQAEPPSAFDLSESAEGNAAAAKDNMLPEFADCNPFDDDDGDDCLFVF